MIAMHFFSDIVYFCGGLAIFAVVILLVFIASKGAPKKHRTEKDEKDDITCAGFSQMINPND